MLNWKTFAIGCSLALALLLFARKPSMSDPNAHRAVIDLTHSLNDRSPNWEGTEQSPFQATELGNIKRDGYYSRTSALRNITAPTSTRRRILPQAHGRWTRFPPSDWFARW